MREIRPSGSMRGGRKRAFARRACLLLYGVPRETFLLTNDSSRPLRSFLDSALSSDPCLRLQLLHEPIPLTRCRNHYSASRAIPTYALTRASTKEPVAANPAARDKPPAW